MLYMDVWVSAEPRPPPPPLLGMPASLLGSSAPSSFPQASLSLVLGSLDLHSPLFSSEHNALLFSNALELTRCCRPSIPLESLQGPGVRVGRAWAPPIAHMKNLRHSSKAGGAKIPAFRFQVLSSSLTVSLAGAQGQQVALLKCP